MDKNKEANEDELESMEESENGVVTRNYSNNERLRQFSLRTQNSSFNSPDIERNLFRNLQVNLCQKLLFLHQLTHKYDDRFFIELQVQYMKIPSSSLGRTCCVQKLFLTFRKISVHNMFSPCSAKRRASDQCTTETTFLVQA